MPFQASLRDTRPILLLFPALKRRAKFIPTLRVEELIQRFLKELLQGVVYGGLHLHRNSALKLEQVLFEMPADVNASGHLPHLF